MHYFVIKGGYNIIQFLGIISGQVHAQEWICSPAITPPPSPYGPGLVMASHPYGTLIQWPYIPYPYDGLPDIPEHRVPSYHSSPVHAGVIQPRTPILPKRTSIQAAHYASPYSFLSYACRRPVGRVLFPTPDHPGVYNFYFHLKLSSKVLINHFWRNCSTISKNAEHWGIFWSNCSWLPKGCFRSGRGRSYS